jgi:hypothetical protein
VCDTENFTLTQLPTPYRVYLIDTGYESIYSSLMGPMSLGSVSQPRVAWGDAPGGGPGGGEGVRGVSAPHIQ